MKPAFSVLWGNYPQSRLWSREKLFREIGWDSLIDETEYRNTCAIRLSVALQKSGVSISSSAGMTGLKGMMKGKAIEIRQDNLSKQLRQLWGGVYGTLQDKGGEHYWRQGRSYLFFPDTGI